MVERKKVIKKPVDVEQELNFVDVEYLVEGMNTTLYVEGVGVEFVDSKAKVLDVVAEKLKEAKLIK